MKTFDTVQHKHLMSKLKSYWISDPILRWTEYFLEEKRQKVVVNGADSQYKFVLSGIPQGSVLGSIICKFHFNEFPDMVNSEHISLPMIQKSTNHIR